MSNKVESIRYSCCRISLDMKGYGGRGKRKYLDISLIDSGDFVERLFAINVVGRSN